MLVEDDESVSITKTTMEALSVARIASDVDDDQTIEALVVLDEESPPETAASMETEVACATLSPPSLDSVSRLASLAAMESVMVEVIAIDLFSASAALSADASPMLATAWVSTTESEDEMATTRDEIWSLVLAVSEPLRLLVPPTVPPSVADALSELVAVAEIEAVSLAAAESVTVRLVDALSVSVAESVTVVRFAVIEVDSTADRGSVEERATLPMASTVAAESEDVVAFAMEVLSELDAESEELRSVSAVSVANDESVTVVRAAITPEARPFW